MQTPLQSIGGATRTGPQIELEMRHEDHFHNIQNQNPQGRTHHLCVVSSPILLSECPSPNSVLVARVLRYPSATRTDPATKAHKPRIRLPIPHSHASPAGRTRAAGARDPGAGVERLTCACQDWLFVVSLPCHVRTFFSPRAYPSLRGECIVNDILISKASTTNPRHPG